MISDWRAELSADSPVQYVPMGFVSSVAHFWLQVMGRTQQRERFGEGVDSLHAALAPFVSSSTFLKGGYNTRITKDVILSNRALLCALAATHPSLAFRDRDMKTALGKCCKDDWLFDKEQQKAWEKKTSYRLRNMCRKLSQAGIKQPKWWQHSFGDQAQKQRVLNGDTFQTQIVPLANVDDEQGEESSDEEGTNDGEDKGAKPWQDDGLYGWSRDTNNAFRYSGNAHEARIWAQSVQVPDGALPSDSVVAIFNVHGREVTKEIADMTIEEYSLRMSNRLKVAGATKFAELMPNGEPIYVSVKKDRKTLVVVETKGEKKRKQLDQVLVKDFGDIEDDGVAFMIDLAKDVCQGKVTRGNLKMEKAKRFELANPTSKKRPAASCDAESKSKRAWSEAKAVESKVVEPDLGDHTAARASRNTPRGAAHVDTDRHTNDEDENGDDESESPTYLCPALGMLCERYKYGDTDSDADDVQLD